MARTPQRPSLYRVLGDLATKRDFQALTRRTEANFNDIAIRLSAVRRLMALEMRKEHRTSSRKRAR